jgi:hypothetical protein
MSANRTDDCGRCELLPTTTGWGRATQTRCPVHGSRPDAPPAEPTPPPVPPRAGDLYESWRRYAREMAEVHGVWDEAVADGRTAAAAELPSGTAEILAWLERHGLSATPGVALVLAAVRIDLRAEGTETDG